MKNVILVTLVLATCFYVGYMSGEAKWDKERAELANKHSNAMAELIQSYNQQLAEFEHADEEAKTKIAEVENAAATADATASRLQQQLDSILQSTTSCPTETGVDREHATAATSVVVLTDVLRRADKRAGELAVTADQAITRGIACQNAYKILIGE